MALETCHTPVMKDEVVEMLRARDGGIFLDGTIGGGGHAEAVLEANSSNVLFGCDRDSRALERASRRLERFSGRFNLFHSRFSEISGLVSSVRFDGILLDLGISTDQLKENRGFSFEDTSVLDMRMDEHERLSAGDIVNKAGPSEMFRLLKQGGLGRESHAVVEAIVRARPINETRTLARVVNRALAGKTGRKDTNPSTVVFQALRIAVNREYEELEAFLKDAPSLAKPGTRFACISFHSGEDKIVAGTFREWASGDTAPAHLPVARSRGVLGHLVDRKAITASDDEVAINPSSRSAKLRVFEFC